RNPALLMYSSSLKSTTSRLLGTAITLSSLCPNVGAVVLSTRPRTTNALTPAICSSSSSMEITLSVAEGFPQHEAVAHARPGVVDVAHQLPHEVQPQPAHGAILQRPSQVRQRGRERVERSTIVLDLGDERAVVDRHRDLDPMGQAVREAIAQDVAHDFVQR